MKVSENLPAFIYQILDRIDTYLTQEEICCGNGLLNFHPNTLVYCFLNICHGSSISYIRYIGHGI